MLIVEGSSALSLEVLQEALLDWPLAWPLLVSDSSASVVTVEKLGLKNYESTTET